MNEIKKFQRIHKEGLSKAHFFEHLIALIEEKGYLSEEQWQKVQLKLLEILTRQIEIFNKGQSSSIQKQKAEALMASIYFTLGVYFRELEDIDESIEILGKANLEEAFSEGKRLIHEKVERCKLLYEKAKATKITTENIAYNDTLGEGLNCFFKSYDEALRAEENCGDIDYPLCIDKMEEIGVLYIEGYLNKFIIENRFCQRFDNEGEIDRLLYGYHEGAQHLLINIFERVLINAIGNMILGRDGLRLSEEEVTELRRLLRPLEENKLKLVLYQGAKMSMTLSKLEESEAKAYVYACVDKWLPIFKRCLEREDMTELFVVDHESVQKRFSISAVENKMDDDTFRALTDHIREMESTSKKLQLIREHIANVEDLKDLFEADCIYDEEFEMIFSDLSDMEIALLIRYSMMDEFASIDIELPLEEKEWRKAFAKFVGYMEEKKKLVILALAKEVEII